MSYFSELYKIYPPNKLSNNTNSKFNKEKIVAVLEKEQFDLFEFYDILQEMNLSYNCSGFERIILNSYIGGENIDDNIKHNISSIVLERYNLDKDKFLYSLIKDSESSKNLGSAFSNFVKNTKYYKDLSMDLISDDSIWITTANDNKLKDFVLENYNIKIDKGIDAIARTKSGKILIIEAKLITNSGGAQNLQLNNAIKVGKISKDNIEGIALVDGIIYNNYYKPVHWLEKDFYDLKKENKLFSATKIIKYLEEN